MSEVICLRCGCPIEPGQYKAYCFKASVDVKGALQAYEIDKHLSADDCMVALRRKEVAK